MDAFHYTRRHWPSGSTNVEYNRVPICRNYLHGPENLWETTLLGTDKFHDKMADQSLGPDEYKCALSVWHREHRNKTLADYLEFAITTGCLFMADIITAFRKKVNLGGRLKLDPMQ